MKRGVDPRQLLFSLEYSKKNADNREENLVVEQKIVKKATILSFSSFSHCVEQEKKIHEKNILLSAAQKLKW